VRLKQLEINSVALTYLFAIGINKYENESETNFKKNSVELFRCLFPFFHMREQL